MRLVLNAALVSLLLGAATLPGPASVLAAGPLRVGGTARVTGTEGSGLRVRSAPGTDRSVLIVLAEGRVVPILEGPRNASGETWYRVQTRGPAGWVMARYLTPSGSSPGAQTVASAPTAVPPPAATRAPAPGSGAPRSFVARVTGYSTGNPGVGTITATGTTVRWGVVAVDPSYIPLGSHLEIEGLGGRFVAEDTGGAVRGAHVDVFLPDPAAFPGFTTQNRRVTVVREGPGR